MSKKPQEPLVIVATKTVDEIQKYSMIRMRDDLRGDYLVNAALETHHSPYTGQEIATNGRRCANPIESEEACVGVRCHECEMTLAMVREQTEQASNLPQHCVVCGTELNYTIAAAEDKDDAKDKDAGKKADGDGKKADDANGKKADDANGKKADDADGKKDGDDKDKADDKKADDAKDKDAGKKADDADGKKDGDDKDKADDKKADDANGKKADDADGKKADDADGKKADDADGKKADEESSCWADGQEVALMSMVNNEDEISFQPISDYRYGAFMGDVMVAFMDDDESRPAAYVTSPNFKSGIQDVGKKRGLTAALESAGFEMVSVPTPPILVKEARALKEELASTVDDQANDKINRFRKCMDIAATGGMVGMFHQYGMDAMAKGLTRRLAASGVENAAEIVADTMAASLPEYSEALVATAIRLVEKSDTSLSTLSEEIEAMSPSNGMRIDAQRARVEDRLRIPGTRVKAKTEDETAAAAAAVAAARDRGNGRSMFSSLTV